VWECSIPRAEIWATSIFWSERINPVLCGVGAKYGKTSAQVAFRFLLQKNVVLIPKSTHKNRMEENLSIFDFALDTEDMGRIERLDEGESAFF